MLEAHFRMIEELLLSLGQKLSADLAELGAQRLLGFDQFLPAFLEMAGIGLERGKLADAIVPLLRHFFQRLAEPFGVLASLLGDRAGAAAPDQPAQDKADRQSRESSHNRNQRIHHSPHQNEART